MRILYAVGCKITKDKWALLGQSLPRPDFVKGCLFSTMTEASVLLSKTSSPDKYVVVPVWFTDEEYEEICNSIS